MTDKPFLQTASGLKYRILRAGDGRTKANNASSVTVHYKGWLPAGADGSQGREFDSSYKRGEPISFQLNGVIKGWTEGMQLVTKGGMIELEIPSELGYGAQGSPGSIPPNATLRFIVELLDVK
jgi:FKBP-type peptidyl-prolyl cis-trans isomerase